MDSWTETQIKRMEKGGNQQCKEFLSKHGIDVKSSTIREKYDTPAAQLYQSVLKARVEGLPEPTELPKPQASVVKDRPMQGFGSSPRPPIQKDHPGRNMAIAATVSVAAVVAYSLLKK